MLNLIAAALVAAAPAPAASAQPADAHSQHQQPAQQPNHAQHGQKGKDCCEMKMADCKDMMAKMHEGHGAKHSDQPNR